MPDENKSEPAGRVTAMRSSTRIEPNAFPRAIKPVKRTGLSVIKDKAIELYTRLPERSYDDLNYDLTNLRASMLDLFVIMESYVKGVLWLISLPVRILTGLASLAVAAAVLLPIILIFFIAFGKSDGTALEKASQEISDGAINWIGQQFDSYSANHPNSLISRTFGNEGTGTAAAPPAGTMPNPSNLTIPPTAPGQTGGPNGN